MDNSSRDGDVLVIDQDDEVTVIDNGVADADAHAALDELATKEQLQAPTDTANIDADATVAALLEPFHAHDTGAMPVVIVAPTGDGSGDVVVSEWTQCVNDHGETYYCNVYTGETCWQLPVLDNAPVDQTLDEHSDALNGTTDSSTLTTNDGSSSPLHHHHHHGAHSPTRSSLQLVQQVLDGELKRLDRNVQLQLEETRRRHRELEDLRDEEVRLGGEHWVEMYDPTHARFYYYGTFSGDLRWDKPPTYVLTVASDAVLRVVVKLQCAFRMTLARRRVFERKRLLTIEQQRLMAAQRSSMDDSSDASALDSAPLPFIDETESAPQDDNSVWVEVYDLFHRVVYYYCAATGASRWDPPSVFISTAEDKEMAAAIAIQSLSRSFLARRAVQQRKRTLRTQRQAQAMAEARRLREVRHAAFLSTSDDARESSSRREMIEEEMEQIRHGDRFWGLDAHDREVRRQQTEERLLATAEVFWQRVNLTMKLRSDRHALRTKELERERHELASVAEALARDAMSDEEAQQRALSDNFWGIQGEEQREAQARRDMVNEERASRSVGDDVDLRARHAKWRIDAEAARIQAMRDAVVHEKRSQTQYMKWFYQHCRSVDDLLEYVWPGTQRSTPHKMTASTSSATSYVLDDLVVKQRLANGDLRYGSKSIVTVHDPQRAQVLGRKGGFAMATLAQTKTVYERAAANRPIESTSPARPAPPRIERTPEEEEHLRMGTAVHYKRSKTPDPHLPARFNGVPFKPSQISPTRDILCSAHTKLTQLPSLKAPSPSKTTTHWVKKPRTHRAVHAPRHRNNNQRNSNSNVASRMHSSRTSSLLQRHEALFGRDSLETIDPMTTSFGFLGPFANESAFRQRHRFEYDDDDVVHEDSEECDGSDESGDDEREHETGATQQHTMSVAQQHRRDALVQQFAQDERALLYHVFMMMDYDRSGTVTKQEMAWALERDEGIAALAATSVVLRAFAKQSTLLDALFDRHARSSLKQQQQQSELSWDVFAAFCEQTYVDLMNQSELEQSNEVDPALSTLRNDAPLAPQSRAIYCEDTEEQTIRELFDLLDNDANGVLEVDELERALAAAAASDDHAVAQLVQTSTALQPLLHHEMFLDAFRKFETADPRGISADEFVGFCLEIASIAMLNDMV